MRANAQQGNGRLPHEFIEESIALTPNGQSVGTVVELDGGDNPACCRVTQDEIEMFLGNLPTGALVPQGVRATYDIGQADLDEMREAVVQCDSQGMEEGQFVSRQKIPP